MASGPVVVPAPAPVPAAERGRLRIADRVLKRIAMHAARTALADSWAGHTERGGPPKVSLSVVGRFTRLTVHLALPYPADLTALARTVRTAVTMQVTTMTGRRVSEVLVVVERLVPTSAVR